MDSDIRAHILEDTLMRDIGFTDRQNNTWYYWRMIHEEMGISFSISVNKNNPDDFSISVLDEDFLQPYDYQHILNVNTKHRFAKKIKRLVEEQMKYLQDLGILSGHICGEYI